MDLIHLGIGCCSQNVNAVYHHGPLFIEAPQLGKGIWLGMPANVKHITKPALKQMAECYQRFSSAGSGELIIGNRQISV
ncbi:hypothetical protein [Pseudomonas sp. MN1F]|uniref:hypothetical protein n=1 Tax=Pseudomonas sp. MN1F TaxID=1366632 RepID=UPI00128F533F|nr:hypothetical protein [Pseudomonas sp. MN1F]MQG95520.1 hypothetical protein [Pseudomonas sp. MN1F]